LIINMTTAAEPAARDGYAVGHRNRWQTAVSRTVGWKDHIMSRLTAVGVGIVLFCVLPPRALGDDARGTGSTNPACFEEYIRSKPIEFFAKKLDDQDLESGHEAVFAMEVFGPATPGTVPVLIKALKHREPFVRRIAAHALASFGDAAKAAVPAVRLATRDPDASVRIFTASALWTLAHDVAAVPVLIEVLEDTDPGNRLLAVEAIGKIGPPAQAAIPSLVRRLSDDPVQTRVWAAEAIGKIGGNLQQLLPPLVRACGDSHCRVRQAAAQSLGKMGPHAKHGAPILARLLNDLHGTVRVAAAEALWNIERNPAAVARIAAELSTDAQTEPKVYVPATVPQAPGQYNDDAVTDLPAVVHYAAIDALVRIAPSAPQAVVVLRDIKRQTERSVHVKAAVALEKIVATEDPLPTLIAALTSSKFSVRIVAADVLREMGPRAKSATPALLQAMHRCADEASRIPKSTDSDVLDTLRANFETNSALSHSQAWLNMLSALRQIDPREAATYESGREFKALRDYMK